MGLANLFSARGRPRRYPSGLCRHENFSGFYHLKYEYTTFYTLSLSWSVSVPLLVYAETAYLIFRGLVCSRRGSRGFAAQSMEYGVWTRREAPGPHTILH